MASEVEIIWILSGKSNQKKIADTEPIKHVVKVEKKWSSWLSQIYLPCRIVKFVNWVKRQRKWTSSDLIKKDSDPTGCDLSVAAWKKKKQIIVNRKSNKVMFD